MELARILPMLLGLAWLAPLASFTLIVLVGRKLGKEGFLASYVATGAILTSLVLSLTAFGFWLSEHPPVTVHLAEGHGAESGHAADAGHDEGQTAHASAADTSAAHAHESAEEHAAENHAAEGAEHAVEAGEHHAPGGPVYYAGYWYQLVRFGKLRLDIGYYIDALTVSMFCMVTLIASCIHFYAIGYMHDELHDVTDHEVRLANGHHLHRRGRFHRFFQYLSLFCFSMLGLVIAGNVAMVFVFWELVGICSYFLIGFYIERKSASNAANKAFIVNRVGDFGMIIGMMALFGALGTFNFGDVEYPHGVRPGLFTLVRPAVQNHELTTPDGMVLSSVANGPLAKELAGSTPPTAEQIEKWRNDKFGYGLLIVAGLGIFCGCVGKSAQFPLHVWLPDAMEGPTPVSALVHSATMVAAGVYLVGRFYPVFAPEALLVIAYVGAITLFLAATIAITATDIKRVLAYSTVSQLGYMMLALGAGAWLAGLYHLFTHAFFKSLLFLGSGSVIHACHTNDMTKMGGLRHKMPWTAYTMLIGCMAIAGAGIPLLDFGLSGYYSKDSILAQVMSFANDNPTHSWLFFAAAGGAAITAFYMFRLWFMTFAGPPRDEHVHHHVHESPRIMYMPLVILSVFAVAVAWSIPGTEFSLNNMLELARPAGATGHGLIWTSLNYPHEHASHAAAIHVPTSLIASGMALIGFLLATAFYGVRALNPDDVRRQFAPIYRLLWNKWWFDELYNAIFVQPVMLISKLVANCDKQLIDGLIDRAALAVRKISDIDDLVDRYFVDGIVNVTARWTYRIGVALRGIQTGYIRTYVMLIVVGTIVLFVAISHLTNVWGFGLPH